MATWKRLRKIAEEIKNRVIAIRILAQILKI